MIENSKHCQKCDRCVYEFDHHCRWISNDIGRFNYIAFMRMLIFVILTLVSYMANCVVAILEDWDSEAKPSDWIFKKQEVMLGLAYICFAFSSLLLVLVCCLFSFHAYLIRKNITTLRYIRIKSNQRNSKVIKRVSSGEHVQGSPP